MPDVDTSKLAFVLRSLSLPADLRAALEQSAVSGLIANDQAERLRSICTERFNSHGFNAKLELTEEGRILDDLIHELLLDPGDEA